MHIDKRTRARELAIQALYQLDVQGGELLPRLMGEFFTVNEPDERTRKLAWEWTQGTWEHVEVCDELIVSATIRWQFSRLSPVDKSILRLAVYQLKCCSDIPPKVVINEAIELAKKYSTEKSGPFVNGVLDAVLKKLNTNPQRMEDKPRSAR
jgi:transcription antitermination factor NusB